ncbi:SecDF P1 head subdomain-containing protein [Kordia sp.]|uniref:SecDF P1 head subdomain-containing protein n=1 Tax=Kordia sp. TaxID=1965332 RepID=UPI003B594579
MIVEFEIEETNLNRGQKKEAIAKLKNRLVSTGAKNIEVLKEEGQKVMFSYQQTIEPETLKRNFAVTGKLEFFEVVTDREIVIEYLLKEDEAKKNDTLMVGLEEDVNKVVADYLTGFLSVMRLNHRTDSAIATIDVEDEEHLKPLLEKEPEYIPELKRRIKFLLGRSHKENEFALYAVYVTSENKAPLDGNSIVHAAADYGQIQGMFVINLEMNKEGALTWERLTEKVYHDRGFIAITLDDFIYSAPSVTTGKIVGGKTQISGAFSKEEAEEIAAIIGSGTIPKVKITKMMFAEESNNEK